MKAGVSFAKPDMMVVIAMVKYLCVYFSLWEVSLGKRREDDAVATQDVHRLMYVVGE